MSFVIEFVLTASCLATLGGHFDLWHRFEMWDITNAGTPQFNISMPEHDVLYRLEKPRSKEI
jgi:hypothetical protein